jgi:hypothetical protein
MRVNHAAAWPKHRILAMGLTAVGALLLIWLAYRFSIGPLEENGPSRHYHQAVERIAGRSGRLHDLLSAAVLVPVPAPELFRGLWKARQRAASDLSGYILGRMRPGLCWYFFLVALAVKSPLAFLILVGVGVAVLLNRLPYRADWRFLGPTVAAVTILLVTMPFKLHLGVRYILVVYPLLSTAAGFGAVSLWQNSAHRRWARAATVLLLGWLVVCSVRAHPDYLPYFNELAGSQPERILVDSDLDWGQDLLRLEGALRSRRIDKIAVCYFGTADPSKHGLPPFTQLVPFTPATGWIAISIFKLKEGLPEPAGAYSWLEAYQPAALVGKSIRLYDIPGTPSGSPGKTPPGASVPH